MKAMKWVWKFLKPHAAGYFVGYGMMIIFLLVSLTVPWFMGQIVDVVMSGEDTSQLLPLLALITGITFARTAFAWLMQMQFEKGSQKMLFDLRADAYARLNRQDFPYFDTTRTGDIMARMTGDMDAVRHFLAHVAPNLYKNAIMMLMTLGMMFMVHPMFAFILTLCIPLVGFIGVKFAKQVLPLFFAIRNRFSRLNTAVQENISGNRVVKAFAQEAREIEKFTVENEAYAEANIKAANVWIKYLPVLEFLSHFLNVVILLAGTVFVIQGSLTLGGLVIFNQLIGRLNGPMRMLGWLLNDAQRFTASSQKIEEMMEALPRISNTGVKLDELPIRGAIEFCDVSFAYGDVPVLHDVSFRIEPGKTVAFIGATGSGKSTIMNLICRFYEANEGLVLLDGVNVINIDLSTLRSKVSIAMQDVFLFTDTIEGNIAYGTPDASFEQVQDVARMAEAEEFIHRFPEGYDTIVGERGVGLSGGQKQRIALARTLLKDPAVLILDDTTSSLDAETEHRIQMTLKEFSRKRTTLIIAHRISSVMHADCIFVMEHGRIIEQGTHEDLLAQEGIYRDIYRNQTGDFNGVGVT